MKLLIYVHRNNKQINSRQQVKGKLGHVGTNSRLLFEVNMMANLSINHFSFGFFDGNGNVCL